MTNATLATAVDTAVADAKNLPQLVNNLSAVDPALAAQLTGKALLASKSPWGTLLAAVVAYAASRFGLGWDHDTCALVAGVGVLVGAYIMRAMTKAPITSVTPPAPTVTPLLLLFVTFWSLAACTPQQLASAETAIGKQAATAQLYCGIATSAGPLTVALVSAADPKAAPVAVTTAEAVRFACSLVSGIPVSPPPAGVVAPTVAVPGNLPTVPQA